MIAHATDSGNDGVLEAGFLFMLFQLIGTPQCEFQRIHADHIRLSLLKRIRLC